MSGLARPGLSSASRLPVSPGARAGFHGRPGCRPKSRDARRFVPKTLIIEGVRHRQDWAWSPGYAAWVREHMSSRLRRRTQADYEETVVKYARWLAARDGVDVSGANHAECQWSYGDLRGGGRRERWGKLTIEAVRFVDRRRSWNPRRYAGGHWRGEPDDVSEIAVIRIPNHDFVPTVRVVRS